MTVPTSWEGNELRHPYDISSDAQITQVHMSLEQTETGRRYQTRTVSDSCNASMGPGAYQLVSVQPEGAVGDQVESMVLIDSTSGGRFSLVRIDPEIDFGRIIEGLYEEAPVESCESCPLPD